MTEYYSTDLALKISAIALNLKTPNSLQGVYIEAGANDGITQNNTYLLEKSGWSGFLIEPSPIAYQELVKNRPNNRNYNVALTSSNEIRKIAGTFTTGSLMASADVSLKYRDHKPTNRLVLQFRNFLGLKNKISLLDVPATTISEILIQNKVDSVDIFVLDVEGYELEVLKGMGEFRPRILIVETQENDTFSLCELLLSFGYVLVRNLSEFNIVENPGWSEDHQDYAWALASDKSAITAILNL